jgi:hypothetical protein
LGFFSIRGRVTCGTVCRNEVLKSMTDADGSSGPLSESVRRLSSELALLDLELRSSRAPEKLLLQEFRHVLDNARLTAWIVAELSNARERQQDPAKVLSFVVAERLRRSNQMLKDLCADINREEVSWQTTGIQGLFETVKLLEVQLIKLIDEHRVRYKSVSEVSR